MSAQDPGFFIGRSTAVAYNASDLSARMPFAADVVDAATVVVGCLTEPSRVYRSAEETLVIAKDSTVRSCVDITITIPMRPLAAPPSIRDLLVPVALVPRRAQPPRPPTVMISGCPAAIVPSPEADEITAAAVCGMVLEESSAASVNGELGRLVLAVLQGARSTEVQDVLNRMPLAPRARQWLLTFVSQRPLLVAVPVEMAGHRVTVACDLWQPTLQLCPPLRSWTASWQALSARRKSDFTTGRTLYAPLSEHHSFYSPRLPHGVICEEYTGALVEAETSTMPPAVTLTLQMDRQGLVQLLRCFVGLTAALLLVAAAAPGLLEPWHEQASVAWPTLLLAPGLVGSVLLRPEMGKLLRHFLAPLQAVALTVSALMGGAMTVLLTRGLPQSASVACGVAGVLLLPLAAPDRIARLLRRRSRSPFRAFNRVRRPDTSSQPAAGLTSGHEAVHSATPPPTAVPRQRTLSDAVGKSGTA